MHFPVTFEPDPITLPHATSVIFYAPNTTGEYIRMCVCVCVCVCVSAYACVCLYVLYVPCLSVCAIFSIVHSLLCCVLHLRDQQSDGRS